MKKLNLMIIGLISCFCSIAQQKLVNDIVNINLPKGAEKITNDQLQNFMKGKTGYFQKYRIKSKGDIYRLKGMIIQLNAFHKSPSQTLEDTKKSIDWMTHMDGQKTPSDYTSEIKNINNYKVLITHYAAQDYASFHFYSVNNTNTAILNGSLEYDKTDKNNKDKAEKALEQMLKSMTFK